jgi:hypothetical protein
MKKKLYIPKEKEFYLLNDRAEVFAGLKKGLPFFSSNWDDGKPLVNDKQVKLIIRGYFGSKSFEKCYV